MLAVGNLKKTLVVTPLVHSHINLLIYLFFKILPKSDFLTNYYVVFTAD